MSIALPPASATVPEISREEILRRLNDPNLAIMDVLPAAAYAERHIAGAINVPVAEIRERARAVLPDPARAIAVYCGGRTWPLGEQAVGLLRALGFHDVRHYAGGIADWVEHGGPVEAVPAPAPVPRPAPAGAPRRAPARVRGDWWPTRMLEALAGSSFGTLLRVWLGLVLGCGVGYWLLGLWRASLMEGSTVVGPTLEGLGTAVYFSIVTATSVGFGDVAPVGPARVLAAAESVAGLLLVGCVISKLVSRRQEQLVEEIHGLAFENQLGRVRTNLRLVLSDLQDFSGACSQATAVPDAALPRLESTAVVFAGELRAVHDLLYRPQQPVEEAVLETILAILAAGLEGLRDLLQRLPAARERSSLKATLRTTTALADEICGSCVPRACPPEMKVWMDRIQELARGIEPA